MLHIVGIDIGSVALSVVILDENGTVINSSYRSHQGAISETLLSMLDNIDLHQVGGIAMTLSGPATLSNVSRYDTQIAIIALSPESRQYIVCRRREFRSNYFQRTRRL